MQDLRGETVTPVFETLKNVVCLAQRMGVVVNSHWRMCGGDEKEGGRIERNRETGARVEAVQKFTRIHVGEPKGGII